MNSFLASKIPTPIGLRGGRTGAGINTAAGTTAGGITTAGGNKPAGTAGPIHAGPGTGTIPAGIIGPNNKTVNTK